MNDDNEVGLTNDETNCAMPAIEPGGLSMEQIHQLMGNLYAQGAANSFGVKPKKGIPALALPTYDDYYSNIDDAFPGKVKLPSFKKGGLSLYDKMTPAEKADIKAEAKIAKNIDAEIETLVRDKVNAILKADGVMERVEQKVLEAVEKRVANSSVLFEALQRADKRLEGLTKRLLDEEEAKFRQAVHDRFKQAAEDLLGTLDVRPSIERKVKQARRRLIGGPPKSSI